MKIVFTITVACLSLMGEYLPQQSKLPATMPAETEISYNDNGGMSRAYHSITIKQGKISFDALEYVTGKQGLVSTKWSAQISPSDLSNLYHLFVVNSFDGIKNDERKSIVYDAGSEGISISMKAVSYQANYGANQPLSGNNLKHYRAIQQAIIAMAAKYKPQKS